jgi:sugar phosphate isomerase/epimerase
MKLAYSSNAYMRFPVDEAIRRIAALGYQGIELMFDTPHAWPEDVTPADLVAVREALNDADLTISNVNAFMMNKISDPRQPYWHPSWIEPDEAYRQIRIDHTIRSLTQAAALDVKHISTEPGGPVEGEDQRSETMDLFVKMLEPVLEHATNTGVKLLIEPEPGLLIETTDQFLELRERIDSPALGLNLDVGHHFCVGEFLPDVIARLAPHIDHVHIEDIAATRVHEHLVPGDGAIDFAGVFDALDGGGYDGWVTVELYPFVEDPDAAGRRAREHLMSIHGFGR